MPRMSCLSSLSDGQVVSEQMSQMEQETETEEVCRMNLRWYGVIGTGGARSVLTWRGAFRLKRHQRWFNHV